MAQVVLENLSKEFPRGIRAVDHIDLAVADGEFLTIVGPSGCGKTTTLRLIAGLERATTGTIRIGGRVVNAVAPHKRNVAMLFQHPALYPHLSVRGNMAFGLRMRSGGHWLRRAWLWMANLVEARQMARERANIRPRVRQAAAALGIETLLERRPGELSSGERQRVALAKATLRHPEVFLFDEPLSNLDAGTRVLMRRELKELHRSLGGTVIYVTHDQVEAMTLGDRVAVLDQGQVQQIGRPTEVYRRPANRFVAGFVGAPAMNFAEGILRRASGGRSLVFCSSGGWQAPLAAQPPAELLARLDRPIVLGLRPADVHLCSTQGTAEATISARIALVEPLGDATIVHLECAGSVPADRSAQEIAPLANSVRYIVSKCDGRSSVRCGECVQVSFDIGQAHWFDRESGENVCAGEAPWPSSCPAA
jgi:ABC-type sugar transport system ATPase subunit